MQARFYPTAGDFDETQRRHMERTTVLGTPSGYAVIGG
jgi:hypothetical protein